MNSMSRQRPAAELEVELRVLAGRDALALDARLHAPDLADVVLGERSRYTNVLGQLAEPPAQRRRRRRRTGPWSSAWSSHGSAPPLVVRPEAVERPGQRALVALGAQRGVDRGTSGPPRWSRRSRLDELRRRCARPSWKSAGPSPSYTNSTSMSDAYDELAPAEAAHADHRERDRRVERRQRGLERTPPPAPPARARSLRARASPRMSRVAIRSSSRRLKRRSPARRCVRSAAATRACRRASSTSSARARSRRERRRRRRASSTNSGWRRRASPSTRLEPRSWHVRSARARAVAEGHRRARSRPAPVPRPGAAAAAARGRGRATPTATRASAGSICSHELELPVSPRVSSRSAARVRSASVKPKAAQPFLGRLAARARPVARRGSRGSGAKNRRSWIERDRRPGGRGARPRSCSSARPLGAVAVAEHPGQARPRLLVGGQRVRLLLVVELQPVLDGPEEPVRGVEPVGVGPVDVAAGRELRRARRASSGSAASGRARPWTSCSSCTANSMSRMPPRPALELAVVEAPALVISSARAFMARTARTASGSSTSGHTSGGRGVHEPRAERRGRRPPVGP